ncbi:PD40 domain-containing protein [Actinomadura rayongensis]|uniref:Uncharacterized protein n=1 Tax=Actinomadura rayongensis TaxID=1429076 RepID=A0A6I4W3J6_9ACTN|nr:PD40 domain-containing protein [Actinomadura rayongensis]MXQ62786.1 hypothetical protein [Actinomadura rayongensis]
MADLEDRLRDALRAAAATVDEHAGRPFPTPARRAAPVRRWTPVAAALVVLLMVGGIFMVRRNDDDPVLPLARMPEFVVLSTLAADGTASALEARRTADGRLLDRRAAPEGTKFRSVAVAGNGRVVFAAVQTEGGRGCGFEIERFTIGRSGQITGGTPVSRGRIDGEIATEGGLAVTPDGARIAYSAQQCAGDATRGVLGVIETSTAARRESGPVQASLSSLSWTPDGRTLVYVRTVNSRSSTVLVADVGASGAIGTGTKIRTVRNETFALLAVVTPDRRIIVLDGRLAKRTETFAPQGSSRRRDADNSVRFLDLKGRELGARSVRGVAGFDVPLLKLDASGRFLLTAVGAVDLAAEGPAHRIDGSANDVDVAW